ncbi:CidA/LrgA family protein [Pandoraea sputorum]|uniref:Holin-like protein CidA n=1 Tax=Pandoraea sputorum TaxID=93222 RepID=A0A239S6S6_9BURK|nr:CidA/LrgA family protein [Pandoraea sputorum]AJC15663.1 Holin-like protein CidA [Pandoraea sputorum]SNU81100.1 Holin-like protein CidA [Pandoraea sputorum]VVD70670.1 Holin-like protein CidA [Pandoraea sputorum]
MTKMIASRLYSRSKGVVGVLWQIALLTGIYLAADAASRHFHLPLPGGVLGLLVVVALLMSGVLKTEKIKRGADWFLAEMILFFVPLVAAVMQYTDLLRQEGLQLLAVIGVGTTLVMVSTALAVDFACRAERRLKLACARIPARRAHAHDGR